MEEKNNETTKREETVADIVAEMRGPKIPTCAPWNLFAEFADRIEAAAKRETATNCNRLGNVAKLREALEKSHNFLGMLIREDVLPGTLPPEASDLADDVWDALAAPPRNCDMFNDEDDAFAAWHDSLTDGDVVSVRNGFRWLFDTAAQEGGTQ